MKSNNGTQFYQQDRIYGGSDEIIALCHPSGIPGDSYKYAICIDDLYANRDIRYYYEYIPSLRAERSGLKVCKI